MDQLATQFVCLRKIEIIGLVEILITREWNMISI